MSLNENNRDWYEHLNKSNLTPPNYVFGIVWPVLYILIIVSGIIYFINSSPEWFSTALTLYIIQWLLNLSWSPLFFKFKAILPSFVVIILLTILIGITIYIFSITNTLSALLLVPYLLWVSFASYLNGYILFNN